MSDFKPGDRVYDLKIFRLTGDKVVGFVCGEAKDRAGVYVEWDHDPSLVDFMYDDELDLLEV